MKFLIILFSVLILNSVVSAQSKKAAAKKPEKPPVSTQSGWFPPDCNDCAALQKAGAARLGNTIGVLNTVPKKKSSTPQSSEDKEAGSGQ